MGGFGLWPCAKLDLQPLGTVAESLPSMEFTRCRSRLSELWCNATPACRRLAPILVSLSSSPYVSIQELERPCECEEGRVQGWRRPLRGREKDCLSTVKYRVGRCIVSQGLLSQMWCGCLCERVQAAIIQEGEEGYQFYLLAAGLVEVIFVSADQGDPLRCSASSWCGCHVVAVLALLPAAIQSSSASHDFSATVATQSRQTSSCLMTCCADIFWTTTDDTACMAGLECG